MIYKFLRLICILLASVFTLVLLFCAYVLIREIERNSVAGRTIDVFNKNEEVFEAFLEEIYPPKRQKTLANMFFPINEITQSEIPKSLKECGVEYIYYNVYDGRCFFEFDVTKFQHGIVFVPDSIQLGKSYKLSNIREDWYYFYVGG